VRLHIMRCRQQLTCLPAPAPPNHPPVGQVPLKPSPSLVSNNLCTVGGSGLAYIHTRSVRACACVSCMQLSL
jgi:hypothetical protein